MRLTDIKDIIAVEKIVGGRGTSVFVKKNVDIKFVPLLSESLPEIEFIHINIFYGCKI